MSFTRTLPAGVAYTDRLISVLGFRYETWRWDNSPRSRFFTQPMGSGTGLLPNPSIGPNPTATGVVERVDMQLRLWTPFVVFAVYPVLALVAWPLRSVHRRTRNQCSNCSYMLVGNESGVCPECGRARVEWIVPRWQRIVIALLSATIACWLLEFMNHQLALEHRCAVWLLTTFRLDHGMWWVTSICRTLVIGLVSVGVYIYVSPERFGEDDRPNKPT